MSDRSTLLTATRDTLAAHVRAGNEIDAYATFARLVYIAHATAGCEAQGVRLVDLPRLGDVVVRTADDLAALRIEHEAQRAVIDGLRARLATVTRERDEARARIATIDKDVGRLQDVVRVALCDAVKGAIPTANLSRIDGGCSDGDEFEFTATEVSIACGMLTDEIDELRAALQSLRDVAHAALSGDASGPDVEHQIACADAALAGAKS